VRKAANGEENARKRKLAALAAGKDEGGSEAKGGDEYDEGGGGEGGGDRGGASDGSGGGNRGASGDRAAWFGEHRAAWAEASALAATEAESLWPLALGDPQRRRWARAHDLWGSCGLEGDHILV
jgi:hypothetical protein